MTGGPYRVRVLQPSGNIFTLFSSLYLIDVLNWLDRPAVKQRQARRWVERTAQPASLRGWRTTRRAR